MLGNLGIFEQYRWLVRKSIEAKSYEQNQDIVVRYLLLMAPDFSIQPPVAQSLIDFYIDERKKKNMPWHIEKFRQMVEQSVKDPHFQLNVQVAQNMFRQEAEGNLLPHDITEQIILYYTKMALKKSVRTQKNTRKNKESPVRSTDDIINLYRTSQLKGLALHPKYEIVDRINTFCHNVNSKFTDRHFKEKIAINQDSDKPLNYSSWKRISDFMSHPVLFSEDASYNDVKQGKIGNCWFCSLVASFSGNRASSIRTKIYPQQYNPVGVYAIEIFIGQRRYFVLVDDFIPLNASGLPAFGKSNNPNEIWFMLFEKAFAKIWGCYQYLRGGHSKNLGSSRAAEFLSKSFFHVLKIQKKQQKYIWNEIQEYLDEKWVVTMGTIPIDYIEAFGLVDNHAYSVLATFKHKDDLLVVLRNPWGKTEWLGRWSDEDEKTQKSRQQYFDLFPEDDGIFFITIHDLVKYFDHVYFFRFV